MQEKNEGGRKRGRANMRWLDSMKEAITLSLQDRNKAVNDRTFWTILIYRITIGRKQFDGSSYIHVHSKKIALHTQKARIQPLALICCMSSYKDMHFNTLEI